MLQRGSSGLSMARKNGFLDVRWDTTEDLEGEAKLDLLCWQDQICLNFGFVVLAGSDLLELWICCVGRIRFV